MKHMQANKIQSKVNAPKYTLQAEVKKYRQRVKNSNFFINFKNLN